MGLENVLRLSVVGPKSPETVETERILVVGEGGRTMSCSASREVPACIEDLLEELMNDIKVIPGYRCYDFTKVFDKDVKKGVDKCEGIKYWSTMGKKTGMSTYIRSEDPNDLWSLEME